MPLHPDVEPIVRMAGGSTKLAEAIGVKVPSIYNWRRIPPDKFDAVAAACGKTPAELRHVIHQAMAGKPPPADAA